jgi:tetratricopeptide (TPR) repeat protein
LESAVELDPQYGVGWAYLTWAYLDEVRFGYNPLPNSMERAHEAALKAVELAPFEPVAHWALSAYYFINHEVEQFLVQAERTIQLAPNDGSILNDLGNYMVISGHAERGYQLVQKAAALNPMHPNWWYFGMIGGAYWAGDYEEALSYAQKLNMKDYYWQHAWLAVLYGALERRGEAKRAVDDLLELYPDFGEKVRDELRIWNSPEGNIEAYISHLRAAGLDVPEQTN